MAHACGASDTTNSLNLFGRPLSVFGVPVNRETIFKNHKGIYQKRVEKRQRKLIVKSTFIKFFLHQGEQIQCLTTGYSPASMLERIVTGPALFYFKRALIIFTDKRILHIPTHFDRTPRSAISQIMYEDCAQLSIKGLSLLVKYKNGQQDIFPYLGGKERRKIQALIKALPKVSKDAGQHKGKAFLCPSCTHMLPTDAQQCPNCQLKFKSNKEAKLRSAIIPGGGYLYSHYPIAGTLIGIAEITLLLFLINKGMAFFRGLPVNTGLLLTVACALTLEKLIAVFHAQELMRDRVPDTKDFAIRKI